MGSGISNPPQGGGEAGDPTGPAGGVLGGSYPNPSFAADMATQTELDAVAAAKANASHTHAQADVTDLVDDLATLTTAVAGKAATSHSHVIADVTGLQAALDAVDVTGGGIVLAAEGAPDSLDPGTVYIELSGGEPDALWIEVSA